jgi:transposase
MDPDEDIPEDHLVRIVNTFVNRLDNSIFNAVFPGGGRDRRKIRFL